MLFLPAIIRKLLCLGFIRHRNIFRDTLSDKKTIYLTFDDGPHPVQTVCLLGLLQKYNIPATFFVNGDKVEKYPEVTSEIVKQGHLLGNHTYSHKYFHKITSDERHDEICSNQVVISRFQPQARLFRPPAGMLYVSDLFWLIRNDYTLVMWSIDSYDSRHLSAKQIEIRLKKLAKGNQVLLFHDDDPLCIHILDKMIPWWQSQGFSFSLIASQNT
jgi:peptidoglycan/xylan/chitin deacetylase (PgdA/CDA1 family)